MADFMLRFLISNLFISGLILLLFLFRTLLKHTLTSQVQYRLWHAWMGLLIVPFLPFPLTGFPPLFSWMDALKDTASSHTKILTDHSLTVNASRAMESLQDFALSADRTGPSLIGTVLFLIWLTGILIMMSLIIKARNHFSRIRRSALPLQNAEIRCLYQSCLDEQKIKARIPIYSTAFLASPVIAGLFRPRIYLPISVISDCPAAKLRYMLLHELQHYRHKDLLTGCLMDLAGILYWFNPLVWCALREMRTDREIACDAGVLRLLDQSSCADYGYTLLSFAEKMSFVSFSSAVSISGNLRQMQKRLLHIAVYQKPSARRKAKAYLSFCVFVFFLFRLSPALSTCGADQSRCRWDTSPEVILKIDLSSYFHGYRGSFVLYDLEADVWKIYDMEHALLRTSPNSTYKIYDALFGLEEGIITPRDSSMAWDGQYYPFAAWNADQDLDSAMQSSVNWYFQQIDEQLGRSAVAHYLREIGYGNEQISADLSSYWMESALKISPAEQVLLLRDLYQNRFDFALENTEAVKDSLCLFSSAEEHFYGKTGTGRIDGQDISGWFVGFAETKNHTFFFATHIENDALAAGSKAAGITMSLLSDLGYFSHQSYPLLSNPLLFTAKAAHSNDSGRYSKFCYVKIAPHT